MGTAACYQGKNYLTILKAMQGLVSAAKQGLDRLSKPVYP
jgi:hypothetical protein